MFPIYLDSLDEFMLARIVKKFNSVHTGANFYRSCRGARDLVDRIKPVWPLPRHRLRYDMEKGLTVEVEIERNRVRSYDLTRGRLSLPPFEWCRIEDLYLVGVSAMADIQAMGAVKRLHIRLRRYGEEEMQRLMTAAKPETVTMNLGNAHATSAALKDVKNLLIYADSWPNELADLWESKKIFELMSSKKTIIWRFHFVYNGSIIPFLQNWLKGELTGSCEKLTIEVRHTKVQLVQMEKVLNEPEIKNLMRSCAKLPNGYILERNGGGQIRISIDSIDTASIERQMQKIDFSFS